MTNKQSAPGALSSVKVVDLTRGLSGPYCTMLLADLGAQVVKIEPFEGDLTRTAGPWVEDDTMKSFGGFFQSVNRNKRGIAVDLKAKAGRELVRRMAKDADVLVENFRAGVMDRLGLSYEKLAEANPKLIYAAIRGFGDPRTGQSPYNDWPAWDVVAQAMGGMTGMTGYDRPVKAGPGVGDIFPGTLTCVGVLAALTHARLTGKGQFVDVAMYDGIMSMCERIVYQRSYVGETAKPIGNYHPYMAPWDLWPTTDGWVVIATGTEQQWKELVRIMGRPELLEDPRCVDNHARVRNRLEIFEIIRAWTEPRSKAEVAAALGGHVPFGPVNTNADIFADPHTKMRGMIAEVEQPGSARKVQIAANAIHMTATPPSVRHRAPILGEHTEQVLESLGYGRAEIESLLAERVVLSFDADVPAGSTM